MASQLFLPFFRFPFPNLIGKVTYSIAATIAAGAAHTHTHAPVSIAAHAR